MDKHAQALFGRFFIVLGLCGLIAERFGWAADPTGAFIASLVAVFCGMMTIPMLPSVSDE